MTIQKSSKWRQRFKVHPVADVFPMMPDDELMKLGDDIKANGLKTPIEVRRHGRLDDKGVYSYDLEVIEGRSRLEAMQRAGIELGESDINEIELEDDAVVAYVISANIHRRHLTKQQQVELIIAAHEAAADKPRHDGEVSDLPDLPGFLDRRKGGRGKKDEAKAAVVTSAKELGVSKRTAERVIAEMRSKKGADGKVSKTELKRYTPRPMPKPRSGKPVLGLEAARRAYLDLCTDPDVDLDAEIDLVTGTLRDLAVKRGPKTNGAKPAAATAPRPSRIASSSGSSSSSSPNNSNASGANARCPPINFLQCKTER